MKTVKCFKKEIEITEAENQVIEDYRGMMAHGKELIYIGDLSGDPKKVRGTLASMVKKGILDVNKEDGGLLSLFID